MDGTVDIQAVKRPGGVLPAAVVATLGSLLAIAFGIMMASMPIPPSAEGMNMRGFGIGMGVLLGSLGLLGIWTAVGLYSLRPWARISILIFAMIMTAGAALTIVFLALVPIPVPPGKDPALASKILPGMIGLYSIPLSIATK